MISYFIVIIIASIVGIIIGKEKDSYYMGTIYASGICLVLFLFLALVIDPIIEPKEMHYQVCSKKVLVTEYKSIFIYPKHINLWTFLDDTVTKTIYKKEDIK